MYSHSIAFIRKRIKTYYPEVEPQFQSSFDVNYPGILASYILWKCDELEKNTADPLKASRWIGWMYRATESIGLMTIEESRDCARKDKDEVEKIARKIYNTSNPS